MTPIINIIMGVKMPWQESWHEDEPFVSMQECSRGECGLVYHEEEHVGYFGFLLYSGEPHELEETLSYRVFGSMVHVKEFMGKYNINGVIDFHVFTTFA